MNFLPHEAELRTMLRRVCACAAEVDDVIQETYYRILTMSSLAHVNHPKSFVFRSAKNIVLDRIRRDAVVSIEAMANLDDLDVEDTAPSPERVAFARAELKWVIGLIGNLPERCRTVFRARRIHGLSQLETAESLGLTDSVVEHEMMKGMRLMSEMISRHGVAHEPGTHKVAGTRTLGKKSNVRD
jgi:RNA polymerase sigma-70 factor (ECF subfamily)